MVILHGTAVEKSSHLFCLLLPPDFGRRDYSNSQKTEGGEEAADQVEIAPCLSPPPSPSIPPPSPPPPPLVTSSPLPSSPPPSSPPPLLSSSPLLILPSCVCVGVQERSSYLDYQKVTRELEHLSRLTVAWQYWQAEVRVYMHTDTPPSLPPRYM